MKKFLVLLAFILVTSFKTVLAQEVTVEGYGIDRDSAIRNATQTAVEQVVGVYISSQTLMEDFQLQLDEIYQKSQGFVKGIKILEEGKVNSSTYKVKARIDVDTSPNGKLLDELTMILQLNDPRVAVIVIGVDQYRHSARDVFAESCLNEKLVSMGFNHVLDADRVIKINNADLLNYIASGKSGTFKSKDNSIDYLVLGKYNKFSNAVSIPKFGNSGNDNNQPNINPDNVYDVPPRSNDASSVKTNFKNIKVVLKVDVIKYDTGDIVGTFTVEGNNINVYEEIASQNAIAQASNEAAEKLGDTLKKFSSNPVQGLSFTLAANNEKKLQQCIEEIRELGMVRNVYIREIKSNEAVLTIDSEQKPHAIFMALKGKTKLEISIANMSANSCKLKIS